MFRRVNKHTPTPAERKEIARFVDARYLAKKYNVTSRYILRLAAEGRIPCLALGRKCKRFDEAAVAEALEG